MVLIKLNDQFADLLVREGVVPEHPLDALSELRQGHAARLVLVEARKELLRQHRRVRPFPGGGAVSALLLRVDQVPEDELLPGYGAVAVVVQRAQDGRLPRGGHVHPQPLQECLQLLRLQLPALVVVQRVEGGGRPLGPQPPRVIQGVHPGLQVEIRRRHRRLQVLRLGLVAAEERVRRVHAPPPRVLPRLLVGRGARRNVALVVGQAAQRPPPANPRALLSRHGAPRGATRGSLLLFLFKF
mmetsp:Transcript_30353/g.49398  ORF Transcript_30353/g.49398 Transcript_30353/m.49398 type:complete len:242 (-) Transcript_30353:1715-2440(-)